MRLRCTILVLLLSLAPAGRAVGQTCLSLDGIPGPSTPTACGNGGIKVLSFALGVLGGPAASDPGPLLITMVMGPASVPLWARVTTGGTPAIGRATLTLATDFSIFLEDVHPIDYRVEQIGPNLLAETIELSYARIRWHIAGTEFCWDRVSGKICP